MKFIRIYILPALFGLLVYFTVRLLHDSERGDLFWQRSWTLNGIEMCCSVLVGILGVNMFERLFRYFDARWPLQFHYRGIARELLILVGCNIILCNLILTPMAALTDDGLSWADFTDLNVVPTLYAIVYYGIARSSTYMNAYIDSKIKLEKITNDHLQTELKFLKAQYHPHFLFNALNTIYFQVDEDVAGAKKSIEKFSELLRYQLYDQQQQVPVTKEIEYLQSYIALQQVRSSNRLRLSTDFDIRLNGQMVYPLLFLPLVENAFKFVGGDYNLKIAAVVDDGMIDFKVENSVAGVRQASPPNAGGIGLENLKRRLDLLYPGKYQLYINNGSDCFSAQLKIAYE